MGTVEKRLERVERQNRRMKVIGGVAILIMAALLLVGWVTPSPRILTEDGFIVEDSSGRERIFIGMSDDDEPVVVFYNPDHSILHYINPAGNTGGGTPPPPAKTWAWPSTRSSHLWRLTVWFARPKKGEMRKFHNTPKCVNLRNSIRAGHFKSTDVTKQDLKYAHTHFKDRLEPCSCCSGLFPVDDS